MMFNFVIVRFLVFNVMFEYEMEESKKVNMV